MSPMAISPLIASLHRARTWSVALLFIILVGCAKAPVPTSPSMAPPQNVYLRNSFDTDPSGYLGRFLPQDQDDLDESSGMTLACSVHLSWRFVKGGNVKTTEVFRASSGVQARLGVPAIAEVESSAGQQQVARVAYTLTGKMVSRIEDPAAFAACCKAQPDQCTDRMVGEFLQGTGEVYLEAEDRRSRSARATTDEANADSIGGSLVVDRGVTWKRAVVFPEPVYFAFKATPTPYAQQPVRTCSEWTEQHAEPDQGLVLRATSGPAWSEQAARHKARKALTQQVERATGLAAEATMKDTVLGVQELDWCVERVEGPQGVHHAAYVLGVVTPAEQQRVRDLPMPVAEAPAPRTLPRAAPVSPQTPCAPWVDAVPSASDGLFVVGRHALPALTESGARLRAWGNAHAMAGWTTGLGTVAVANGTTLAVQERGSCVDRTPSGGFRAFVLGFVSEAEQERLRGLATAQ